MRAILSALLLSLALSGCAMFAPAEIPVSQQLSQSHQQAQKVINEANITLGAAYNVVAQNVTDGIWTKDEGRDYVGKLNDLTSQVNAATALMKSDPLSAKNQAELLNRAIIALHREIAAKARAK